ncbi:PspC domain-containing protein [Candidatus Woesearchaeota archaeon]|nr:PspC domain-containing protein [Candidatus Woesearchaeota archaeon]
MWVFNWVFGVLGWVIFAIIFGLIALIFLVWVLMDILLSRLSTPQKLFWVFVVFLFNIFGAMLYLIFSSTLNSSNQKGFKSKRLLRSKKNRMIAGVCGGIGEYLGADPTIIRLLWAFFSMLSLGTGVLAYAIAWVIIPEE